MKINLFLFTFLMFLTKVHAYDFSAVCESGQTLYYRILSNGEVAVCPPDASFGWKGHTAPEGALVIPESVEYQGIIYSVTGIDNETFSYCHGITSVVVPNTVISIGKAAFSNIISLSDFLLPNSVTNMGDYVFASTNHIMHEVYNDKIYAYYPRYDQSSCTIPEGIQEIASGAFYDCSMQIVNIPNSVIRIGKGAFFYSSLKSVIIPEGVKSIEKNVFSWSMIHAITLPNSVISIEEGAFSDCPLDTVVLPNTLQNIGRMAFSSCDRLRSVIIPNSVTSIGEGAFSNCSSLTSVVFPNSVENLGAYVFENCHSLSEPVYNCHYFAFYPCGYASFYHIPDGVETILAGVFRECSSLDSVAFPNSVKTIETQAFERCVGLTYVLLPESLETIEDMAFRGCSHLSMINLPNSLNHIGERVFCDCQNLREPLFNNRYFAHFPKNYATTYSILEGIQEVLDGSFVACDSLLSVNFPSSVTRIRDYAVSNCPNLKAINIYPKNPPVIDLNPFYPWKYRRPADAYIYVPAGTLETYMNTQGWTAYYWCLTEMGSMFPNREMYYEILNDDGSITYQHLECVGDTTVGGERPKIIVRTNTIYDDKNRQQEVTHEYVYERDGVVYWWNKELQEYTTLYDLTADEGEEWEIKVGTESLFMHVDAVLDYNYDGQTYRMLRVSDENNVFSGDIICGIGHLTSFFPEKLMTQGKRFRVEGLRCYWMNGRLALHFGDKDCDEVYQEYHNAIDEVESVGFLLFPNPATTSLVVIPHRNPESRNPVIPSPLTPSSPSPNYLITNLLGQTLLTGQITGETQQINVESLPAGMYYITLGNQTLKFIKQ